MLCKRVYILSCKVYFGKTMPVRNKTKFSLAKKDIFEYLNQLGVKVFSDAGLHGVFLSKKEEWRLGKTWGYSDFVQTLLEVSPLKEIEIEFPSKIYTRYAWGEYDILGLVASLNHAAYLSHYSAMYFHNLTEQIPKAFYLNIEQNQKSQGTGLSQQSINSAFSRDPRITNNFGEVDDFKIFILNGKNTNKLGVEAIQVSETEKVQVTNIERTLIDATVRPFYAGGIAQVLEAFNLAASKDVSINRLCAYLQKIGHSYPYHQAIGFYMEKANAYTDSQIKLLDQFEKKFDFYLTYNIKEKEYSPRWRIFYPRGF